MLEDGGIDKDTEKFAVVIAVGVALMKLARTDNEDITFCQGICSAVYILFHGAVQNTDKFHVVMPVAERFAFCVVGEKISLCVYGNGGIIIRNDF